MNYLGKPLAMVEIDKLITERSSDGSAWFSEDRRFRYLLRRALTPSAVDWTLCASPSWTPSIFDECIPAIGGFSWPKLRRLLWIMMNPSTADAFKLDPTVTRCVRWGQMWGFDVVEVCNLAAYRSSVPIEMLRADDRGEREPNPSVIYAAAKRADITIAAWGDNLAPQASAIRSMLHHAGIPLHVLAWNSTGSPRHPLARGRNRIRDDVKPQLWRYTV